MQGTRFAVPVSADEKAVGISLVRKNDHADPD